MATGTQRPATATKESQTRYFIDLFISQPGMLNERENTRALQQWSADHPGQIATSALTKILHNAKSQARKKLASRTGGMANRGRAANGAGNGFGMADSPVPTVNTTTGHVGIVTAASLAAMLAPIDAALLIGTRTDPAGLAPELRALQTARQGIVQKAQKAGT